MEFDKNKNVKQYYNPNDFDEWDKIMLDIFIEKTDN